MRGEAAHAHAHAHAHALRAGSRLLRRRGASPILVVLALVVLGTGDASACGVCISASEETRIAYYVTTVLMMALPFVFLGALVIWLVRGARSQRERQEAALSNSPG